MTEMVYGAVPVREGEPILPKWWRTVDRWALSCVLMLFAVGMLLGPVSYTHLTLPTSDLV